MGAVDNAVPRSANEVSPYLGLCPLVCRLVANGAASSRASAADTDEVVAGRCRTCFLYTDTAVLLPAAARCNRNFGVHSLISSNDSIRKT
jgi:hypothetical protein